MRRSATEPRRDGRRARRGRRPRYRHSDYRSYGYGKSSAPSPPQLPRPSANQPEQPRRWRPTSEQQTPTGVPSPPGPHPVTDPAYRLDEDWVRRILPELAPHPRNMDINHTLITEPARTPHRFNELTSCENNPGMGCQGR